MMMDDVDLVVGVDTHLDSHTAAICDQRGRLLAERQVPTTPAGYSGLADWVSEAAGEGQVVWAIEGSRHYGLGLSRFLSTRGQRVVEIDSCRHIGKRRSGKSDPIDAAPGRQRVVGPPRTGPATS